MLLHLKQTIRSAWQLRFPVTTYRELAVAEPWSPDRERVAWLVLIAACATILFSQIAFPLIEPDETRYAEIAMGMIDNGNWVTPMLDGKPYLDKPPLLYWSTAVSLLAFGRNEIAVRLPSLLSAFPTVMITCLLGRRLVGFRAAWLGALCILLCVGFALASRALILDSMLSLFVVASLLTGAVAVGASERRSLWWITSGFLCALGVMTKGPVAMVLVGPPLLVSGWLCRDSSRISPRQWIQFLVPVVVLCVPWYFAVWKLNPEFGNYFFWEHNFKRFTEGSNHAQPFWFYIRIVFAGMFPASLLLPSLGVFVGKHGDFSQLRTRQLGLLLCASVWILAFFSIATCKLPTYILPALPIVCLMLGVMMEQTVLWPKNSSNGIAKFLKPYPQRAAVIYIASGLIVVAVDCWFRGRLQPLSLFAISVSLLLLGISIRYWNREVAFGPRGWAFCSLVGLSTVFIGSGILVPSVANERSLDARLARAAAQNPNADIAFLDMHPHAASLRFPMERITWLEANSPGALIDFANARQSMLIVMSPASLEVVRQHLQGSHEVTTVPHTKRVHLATKIPSSGLRSPTDGSEYQPMHRVASGQKN